MVELKVPPKEALPQGQLPLIQLSRACLNNLDCVHECLASSRMNCSAGAHESVSWVVVDVVFLAISLGYAGYTLDPAPHCPE